MNEEAANSGQKVIWEISPKSIFLVVGIVFGVWLSYQLLSVAISLFIAVIVTTALAPFVNYLRDRGHLPYSLAILVVYLFVISMFVGLGFLLIPPIVNEVGSFVSALPGYITSAASNLGVINSRSELEEFNRELVTFFRDRLGDFAQGAYNVTANIFSATLGLVSILVFSFYFLLEKENVEQTLVLRPPFIHSRQRRDVVEIIKQVEIKLGAWARGQAALCLIIGIVTFIGLTILGVPYALPLAVIAGILEIVPIIGPIISAIPSILVVLSTDFLDEPYKPLFVILLYVLIQQLENNLIVPQVMKRAIGFSPILSILAIMIGGSLLGIVGALLAIPFLATVLVILEYYAHKHASK